MGDLGWLCRVARRQWGVVSREQVLSARLEWRSATHRINQGEWTEVLPGVFRMAGVPDSPWTWAWAACLWGGPRSALCRHTSAWLHGWTDVPPTKIHILVPFSIGFWRGEDWPKAIVAHRSREILSKDTTVYRGLSVTSAPRTLLDLANQPNLEQILEAAVLKDNEILSWCRARFGRPQRGTRGMKRLRALLKERSAQPEKPDSPNESKFLRLARRAKLPLLHHYAIVDRNGSHILKADFACPLVKLAVEIDSQKYHTSRRAFLRRADIQQRLSVLGWRLMVLTWTDLTEHPEVAVSRVSAAIRVL